MNAWIKLGWVVGLVALAGCGSGKASEVSIEVTDAGFVPAVAYLPKGKAVTLLVTRKTDQTCATEMVFARDGRKVELPLNQTVRVEIPANSGDTLDYACAMNMIHGQLVVR
jgi:plastocyanin domain-containing protein